MNKYAYKDIFAGNIDISLRTAINILSSYPASASAFARIGKGLKKAEGVRKEHQDHGLEIPPLLIVSTTERCNLTCAGCYACSSHIKKEEELQDSRITEILDESSELGTSIVMLAGGEPLLSHGWLEALGRHDEMVGIVFTNGTLFDQDRIEWFAAHRHVIPTFSIEGNESRTDARRGNGVYAKVNQTMGDLRSDGIPFGASITVTSQNIDSILTDSFISEHLEKGCRLFVFVEYVPVEPGSEPLVLSKADKQRLSSFALRCEKKYPGLFIPFPGDEEEFGGCLAAGRGFVHISSEGNVEPCPFAPFSDTNLKSTSLKDALASGLLAKVRENHHLLKEGDGGCALWHNREWLASLKQEV